MTDTDQKQACAKFQVLISLKYSKTCSCKQQVSVQFFLSIPCRYQFISHCYWNSRRNKKYL